MTTAKRQVTKHGNFKYRYDVVSQVLEEFGHHPFQSENRSYTITDVAHNSNQILLELETIGPNPKQYVGSFPTSEASEIFYQGRKETGYYQADGITLNRIETFLSGHVKIVANLPPSDEGLIVTADEQTKDELEKASTTTEDPIEAMKKVVQDGGVLFNVKKEEVPDTDQLKFAIDMMRIASDGSLKETAVMELQQSAQELLSSKLTPEKLAAHVRKLYQANKAAIDERASKKEGKRVKFITAADIVRRARKPRTKHVGSKKLQRILHSSPP
jgi:hypothetical protein